MEIIVTGFIHFLDENKRETEYLWIVFYIYLSIHETLDRDANSLHKPEDIRRTLIADKRPMVLINEPKGNANVNPEKRRQRCSPRSTEVAGVASLERNAS